jgi:hypothetical protein
MTDHSILRQVDHIQKAVDQLVRDLNRPRWECPEPVTSTPLLFEGAPSGAWLQSTTSWPRLLSERVANNVDVFETEEYKDKYRPGEIVNVYRAACPGMRRTALLLHVPQFKVGSCVSGGLDSRMYQIKALRVILWVIFEMFLQFRQARGQDFQLEILLVA